ncbi:hypothetical protein BDW74DRAFT_183064 [Aspergillus multicolor]|uniref:uncharacterized protein n=1 Tax=Aspergillus multicolor TaxID=41759 RepID=UPI003CCD803C
MPDQPPSHAAENPSLLFCSALGDRRYYYSYLTSLDSAAEILKEYLTESEAPVYNIWTVAPHVISASIIVTLGSVYSAHVTNGFGIESKLAFPERQQLILDCLTALSKTENPCQMVRRGIAMVHRLLFQDPARPEAQYISLDHEDISRLVKEIEECLSHPPVTTPAPHLNPETILGFLGAGHGLDSWELYGIRP